MEKGGEAKEPMKASANEGMAPEARVDSEPQTSEFGNPHFRSLGGGD